MQILCKHYHVLLILSVIILNIVNGQTIAKSDYKVPQPTAVVLSPRGFRISIPDERDIILFAFHANINKEIRINEVGDFYGQTRTRSNGLWSYENNQYQLQRGDVLNFWIYVQHGQFGYNLQNQKYVYPDHFVYNSEYSNFGGSSGSINTNDGINSFSNLPWDQEYTTQRSIIMTPSLVHEEPNTNAQPQYTEYTTGTSKPITTASRYTTRPTARSTTRSSPRTSSSNYWPTTQRPIQSNHNYHQNQYSQQNEFNQQQQTHHQNQQNSINQQNSQNCYPSITTVNKKHIGCKDTLVFEEQFNNGFLNRWSQDIRMPLEFEDAEFVLYQTYPSVWNVSNGNLNIYPKLLYRISESGFSESDIRTGHFLIDSRECTAFIDPKQECERQAGLKRILPPVVSAKFRSKKTFNFKFGRVEIRAKLPKGDWIFPQLYLEPTDNRYRGIGDLPYLNGQVRIAFIHGNDILEKVDGIPLDGKILIGVCVISGGDTVREVRKSVHFGQEHFGNDFHTYSIIWTNSSIRFLVDGLEYGTDTGGYKQLSPSIPNAIYWESGSNMAPFDQEFHISLGVGVGGNADFADGSKTGNLKTTKPWENTSPKAELSFFMSVDEWSSTWGRDSGVSIDYVKVYSV